MHRNRLSDFLRATSSANASPVGAPNCRKREMSMAHSYSCAAVRENGGKGGEGRGTWQTRATVTARVAWKEGRETGEGKEKKRCGASERTRRRGGRRSLPTPSEPRPAPSKPKTRGCRGANEGREKQRNRSNAQASGEEEVRGEKATDDEEGVGAKQAGSAKMADVTTDAVEASKLKEGGREEPPYARESGGEGEEGEESEVDEGTKGRREGKAKQRWMDRGKEGCEDGGAEDGRGAEGWKGGRGRDEAREIKKEGTPDDTKGDSRRFRYGEYTAGRLPIGRRTVRRQREIKTRHTEGAALRAGGVFIFVVILVLFSRKRDVVDNFAGEAGHGKANGTGPGWLSSTSLRRRPSPGAQMNDEESLTGWEKESRKEDT
ncbi:hypothetical protein C8J57DRAFT_1248643 [Mycena rebaudengoi]|nr:hypothetical protein C8J57DRAFT_1248643 [Mycena rebaudengoi]